MLAARDGRSQALQALGDPAVVCVSAKHCDDDAFTEGIASFVNRGSGPIHVDDVTLRRAAGLELVDVQYVRRSPDDEYAASGLLHGWPPQNMRPAIHYTDSAGESGTVNLRVTTRVEHDCRTVIDKAPL